MTDDEEDFSRKKENLRTIDVELLLQCKKVFLKIVYLKSLVKIELFSTRKDHQYH